MDRVEGYDEREGKSGRKQEGGKKNKNSEVESPGDHNVGKRPLPRDQGGQAEGRLPRWSVSLINSRFLAVSRHLYTHTLARSSALPLVGGQNGYKARRKGDE